jgi:hypothetical protein
MDLGKVHFKGQSWLKAVVKDECRNA